MTAAELFGTDGVRAWPDRVRSIRRRSRGSAPRSCASRPLERPARIIVGRDTRESGEWIERELARGAAVGRARSSTSAGVMPTPGVAYLAGALDFDLGVVLSASHNPYGDNGIKVFSGRGEKFGEAEERAVEAVDGRRRRGPCRQRADAARRRAATSSTRTSSTSGGCCRRPAPLARRAHRASTWPTARRRRRRRRCSSGLGFDAGHARRPAGRPQHQPRVRVDASGAAGRDGRGASGCRLGVAFDGDGDRAIFVDHRGHIVDGDAVLLMLGAALSARRAG